MTQTTILIRRNATFGDAPKSGTLAIGELALNTADGQVYYYNSVSGSATASLVRPVSKSVVNLTTGLLTSASAELGSFSLGKSFFLYRVSCSYDARIRLYETLGDRDADQNRQPGTDPFLFAEHGIICDLNLTGSFNNWRCAPIIIGANGDEPESGTIYYNIKSANSSSVSISVAFTKVSTQDPDPITVS